MEFEGRMSELVPIKACYRYLFFFKHREKKKFLPHKIKNFLYFISILREIKFYQKVKE